MSHNDETNLGQAQYCEVFSRLVVKEKKLLVLKARPFESQAKIYYRGHGPFCPFLFFANPHDTILKCDSPGPSP